MKGERNWEGRKAQMLVLKHEHNTNKHINSNKHINPQTPKKNIHSDRIGQIGTGRKKDEQ